MALKILYNQKEYSLDELIKEENEFQSQLKFLDFIKIDAISVIIATNHIAPYKNKVIMQKFGALHNMISYARFNLMFAHKKLHKHPIEWRNGYEAQMFLRSNYLQNAILNYNNIRDIFLQLFWFSSKDDCYEFSNIDSYKEDLNKWKNIWDIKKKINGKFLKEEFELLVENDLVLYNNNLSVNIKHYGNLMFKGFENDFYSIPISFNGEESSYLEEVVDIDECCMKLLSLHKFQIDLAKKVWDKLNFESYFEKTEEGYSVQLKTNKP